MARVSSRQSTTSNSPAPYLGLSMCGCTAPSATGFKPGTISGIEPDTQSPALATPAKPRAWPNRPWGRFAYRSDSSMEDTGRIKRSIAPSARRILFDTSVDEQISMELRHICNVDRAHIVMLSERGIVDGARSRRLLLAIENLEALNFAPLRNSLAPRGQIGRASCRE